MTRSGDSERAAASAANGQVKDFAEKPFICNMAARLDAITTSSSTTKIQDPECGDTWVLFRVFLCIRQERRICLQRSCSSDSSEICSVLLIPPVQNGPRRLDHELLRTDSEQDWRQYCGMMNKMRNFRESARATIASVKKEMQKPRLTESVRKLWERPSRAGSRTTACSFCEGARLLTIGQAGDSALERASALFCWVADSGHSSTGPDSLCAASGRSAYAYDAWRRGFNRAEPR
jgi:hypothetical protein